MFESLEMMILGGIFIGSVIIASMSYIRILVILQAIDRGLENPPERKHVQDKLRAYRDWCKDRSRSPVLLYIFATGVFCGVLAWIPIPVLIFR